MKNYNKYFLYFLFGLISVTLLNGCSTKDDFTEDTSKDKETLVEIEVNTKSMSGVNFNGVTISSMRMIIADYESGIILQNLKTSDGTLVPQTDQILPVLVKPGEYKLLIIANEPSALNALLDQSVLLEDVLDLRIEEPVYSTFTEQNIMLFSEDKIYVRATSSPGTGEVSKDNLSWSNSFTAELKRIMAKVSLEIKNSSGDEVKVYEVWLMNRANHFHFGGLHYSTLEHSNVNQTLLTPAPVTIETDYTALISNVLIPENMLAPADNNINNSTYILIGTTYNGNTSVYTVPLGTVSGNTYTDYSTLRGMHYVISGTITMPGTFENGFTLKVLPWNSVDSNIGFENQIVYSGSWAGGTSINQGNVYTYYNESVTYQFTLSQPAGALWAASLTNGQDFKFDYSDGGVSQGITQEGYVYKIKVTPRQLQSAPGIKTDLFITVGGEEIDINLANNTSKRFTIYQIPQ